MSLENLISTLQLSIGPVIVISGVGLLILSMTNRFGRIIDRSRMFTSDLDNASEAERQNIVAQLKILSRRARIVQASITLSSTSVLFIALIIISLFLGAILELEIAVIIVILFILCMLCLIASLILFILDVNLSLQALWLEMPPEGRV